MYFSPQTFRMSVLRRAIDTDNDRGAFAEVFSRLANIRQNGGQQMVDAGLAQSASQLIVRVRDDSDTRTITIADRASLRAVEYAIIAVNPPDRRGGYIEITLQQQIAG